MNYLRKLGSKISSRRAAPPSAPNRQIPVQMLDAEQMLLSALVFALKPQRALEIGTCEGGSAQIIVQAMNRRNAGHLVCIDPEPRIDPDLWAFLSCRTDLIVGSSPGALKDARERAGGDFDFILIDGDHSFAGARADLVGCLEYAAADAAILLHDAHHDAVATAIHDVLLSHPTLTDGGLISTDVSVLPDSPYVSWGGLRLLRAS